MQLENDTSERRFPYRKPSEDELADYKEQEIERMIEKEEREGRYERREGDEELWE